MSAHDGLIAVAVLGFARAHGGMDGELGSRPSAARLKMFLECDGFEDSIREAVDFVEYVSDQTQADFCVRVVLSSTGATFREYAVTFSGAGRFAGTELLVHVGGHVDTECEALGGVAHAHGLPSHQGGDSRRRG